MNKLPIVVCCGSIILIFLAYLLTTSILPKSAPTADRNPTSTVRIGFSLGTLREERWIRDRDLFMAEAQALGANVQVLSANSDPELQNSQIENLISQGVNILVIAPQDGKMAAKTVDIAHRANIKVIAYDRMINDADVDYYVSFDNEKVGKLQAEGVLAAKNRGAFAYIGGAPTDNNASLLKKGSMSVLAPSIANGSIRLVLETFTPDWKPEEAYKAIKNYLAGGGKLDAIVAANDGTALGAIRALHEYNLDGAIPVSGQDAELSACQRIVAGTQTMTVYKPITLLAKKAAEMAVLVAKGQTPDTTGTMSNGTTDIPSYLLDPIVVTKDTLESTVVKDGYHTRDQIYATTN